MERQVLEEKVDRLEEMMMRLAYAQQKTEMELQKLSKEMQEFKDEMRAFKDEMNKKWGWVINKLGTMVEDLIYPSIGEALRKHFGCEPDKKMIRVEYDCVELDAIAICGKRAFVIEAKSKADSKGYVDEFLEKLSRVKDCVDWLREYEVYGIYASWNMNEETIRYLSESGVYAMVVKGDILTIVNEGIKPRSW